MQTGPSHHDPGDKFRLRRPGFRRRGEPEGPSPGECNGFFARLTLACRRRGWRLEWTGERRATASWDSVITPDGIGRVVAGDREISFFLEYDRGTENHDPLENKTWRYHIVG